MRRLLFALIAASLVALGPQPWFRVSLKAAASLVQSKVEESQSTCSGTPRTCTITFSSNITTGNAAIVVTACVTCATNTFSATEATNGAYTKHLEFNSGSGAYNCAVFSKRNATGGFATVNVSIDAGTPGWYMWGYEVSGLATSGTVQTGSNEESTNPTSHTSSTTGLTATGFGVTASGLGITPNYTAGSGWTRLSSQGIFAFSQYQIAAFSSNQGPYTTDSAGNARANCMAIFPEATATAVSTRTLLGVGI